MSLPNTNGPTAGSIFVGHLLSAFPIDGAQRDPSLDSDIPLRNAYIIEGIHVVPNKISPPGFSIDGRTLPDIHTRPFNLMISARNVDNAAELLQILNLTLNGGCQWIPILPPFNQIAIDHLRFHGDFEIISVIIHGMKIDLQMLSAEAQKVVQSGFIDNNQITALQTHVGAEAIDSPDEDEIINVDADLTAPDAASLVIPQNILVALQTRLESYFHRLNFEDIKLRIPPKSLIQQIASSDASKGSCVVALEEVSELVGAIFSLEDGVICSDPSFGVRVKAVNNLIDLMQQCWMSATDDEVKSVSTHEQFSVALGEEAVGVLATILLKLLDCVRSDSVEICSKKGDLKENPYNPNEPDEFRELGSSILRCCDVFMMNDFSAMAFAEQGGLSLLSYIARQSPQLPPHMQAQLMSCFYSAVKHVELLPRLIEPPEVYTDASGSYATDVSVYQTLVLAMGNMRESAPAARYCKKALHWSALAEACGALRVFSESLSTTLEEIAEASINLLAATHKTKRGEREEEERMDEEEDEEGDTDSGKGEDCGMTRACTLLHNVALKGNIVVHAMQAALTVYIISHRNGDIEMAVGDETIPGCCDLSLFELFQKYSIVSSLAALSALSQTAAEFSSLCEWSILLRVNVAIDADTCQQMLISTVASLLRLEGGLGELLLASNASAVHLIWQYLSQEESLLSSQSIGEVLLLSERNGALSNGFLSLHPSSVGWAVWLIGYATGLADSIVSAVGSLNGLLVAQASSTPKQIAGQEKEIAQAQTEIFDAVQACNALTYSTSGCSVVIRVVSQFCLKEVLRVAVVSSDNISGTSVSVLSSAARLVLLCALSGESLVLSALSFQFREQAFKLAKNVLVNPPLSLSDLEESISLAQLGQAAKSSDPRHKCVPVKVMRGYTDDVRHLAQRILIQFQSAPIIVGKEGDSDKDTEKAEEDGDLPGSYSISLEGYKKIIKDFSNCTAVIDKLDENIKAKESYGQKLKFQCMKGIPSFSFAADMIISSFHCAVPEGANGDERGSSLAMAGDGDLLHDLLNAVELICYCMRVSDISKMRYGATNSTSLDGLILVEMVKCCPSDALLSLVEKNNKGIKDVKDTDTPVLSINIEAIDGMKLVNLISEVEVFLSGFTSALQLLLEIIQVTCIHDMIASRNDSNVGSDSSGLSNRGKKNDSPRHGRSPSSAKECCRDLTDHLTNRILNTTMEARAVALSGIGEDKAGDLGSAVRGICSASARIFAIYCPCLGPLDDAIGSDVNSRKNNGISSSSKDNDDIRNNHGYGSADNNSSSSSSSGSRRALVAYICSRAIDRPALLSSNISLLLEIIPTASGHCREIDIKVAYNKANKTESDSDIEKTESHLSILEDKDSISFARWEKFIWEIPDIATRTDSEEEMKKKKEKEKEEELFKGSGALVVPDDPLYTSLHPSEYEGDRANRISVSTIILYALGSTSWELHQLTTVLCAKVMSLGLYSACIVADEIIQAIQRRVALHLMELSPSEEEEKEDKFASELSLSRLFIVMETLCNIDTLCVTFVQQGLLLPVLRVLRGSDDRNVCILAIQLVMTIYRTLLRITSGSVDNNKVKNKDKENKFKNCLLWTLHILSDALMAALPLVMVSFQDTPNGVLLWQQSVLIMSLLPSSIVKKVIETISVTFTIEGLAVKLWLAFEDSYQQLFELTELRKLCQNYPEEKALKELGGEDFGLSAMHSAHMLYTGASCALKAVIDYALMAFLDGTIALPTLARACRCSLSDPKRVVLRYQRAYTMWAVQTQQFIGVSSEKVGKRSAYSPFASHAVVDPQCSSAFDARHELISSALRNAVETTGRVARLVSGRETRPKGGTGILKDGECNGSHSDYTNISTEFDFNRPFTELLPTGDLLSQWFSDNPPIVRLPRLSEIRWGSSADTLHTVLRRGLLYSDDTEVCLYDGYVSTRMEAVRDLLRNKGLKRKLNFKAENDFNKKMTSIVPPPPVMPITNIMPSLAPFFPPPQMITSQVLPPRPPLLPPNQQQQPPPLFNKSVPPIFKPPPTPVPKVAALAPPPLPPSIRNINQQELPHANYPPQLPHPSHQQRWQ